MGFFATLDRHIRAETSGGDPFDDRYYSSRDDAPEESYSGIDVSPQSSLQISTIWKCVNWRARMFGTLPKKVFERTTLLGRSAQVEAPQHHLFSLVHDCPNPSSDRRMTAAFWFGLISADLHLHGNSYAFIERDSRRRPIGLHRIAPEFCNPELHPNRDGKKQLWYMVTGDNGRPERFYPDEILHIRHNIGDGIKGYSAIRMQMNLLGWNKATVRYGAQFFKKASRPSGIVTTDVAMKPEVKKELISNLSASGKEAGRLVLIEGAAKFFKMTMDQDEAQFIETGQFQEDDIAGIMEVKPHEIGIMRHSTNNNIEQETISSVTRCLTPLAVHVEQWLNLQLLSDAPSTGIGGGTERDRFFIQCELKGLLRGDTAAQTSHIATMIDKAVYSPNDGREYLGEAPYEGGDRYMVNGAYVPMDKLDEVLEKRSATPAEPPGKPGDTGENNNALAARMFRDGVGRVVARKKDRGASVAAIFRPILCGLSGSLGKPVVENVITGRMGFIEDYLGAMAQRCTTWTEANADEVAMEELNRAVVSLEGMKS